MNLKTLKTLYEALPVNPFMLEKQIVCKSNDLCTDLWKNTYVTMSAMIEEREKQFQSFKHNILLYQKELCSQEYIRITLIQHIQGKSNWKKTALYLLPSYAKYIQKLSIGRFIRNHDWI